VAIAAARRGHRLVVKPEQEIAVLPEEIKDRNEYGNWEVDLVIGAGQQGVLLVAVERQSRLARYSACPVRACPAILTWLHNYDTLGK